MSQVMNALQKSEKAYQAQMSPQFAAGQQRQLQQAKSSKTMMVLLLLFPFFLVLAWIGYQYFIVPKVLNPTPQQTVASVEPVPVETVQIETPEDIATILPYPSMPQTKALPGYRISSDSVKVARSTDVAKVNNTADTTPSSTSSQQMKPINDPVDNSPEWNVDDLDLSDLPPELAQRFQTALKGQSSETLAANKPQASGVEIPKDIINLVGHESDYRGRLPKMNFETHMYSSKVDSRWIKVNGNNVYEGEWVIDKLVKLEQILPGSMIIQFDNQYIQIPALYEWAG